MNLRVANSTVSSQAILNAQRHTARLAELQLQASTGLRINRPSDDPQGVRDLIIRQSQEAALEVEQGNIQQARSRLNLSVSNLLEANKLLNVAKQAAVEGVQSPELAILAQEVEGVLERLITIANTQDDGRSLFAGQATAATAFTVTPASPNSAANVNYAGSEDRAAIALNSQISVDVFYSGNEVFQHLDRGQTLVLGATGAQAGGGTDSGSGQATLRVRHTATTYAAGSGVQTGASSVDGDTVIGQAGTHFLTIDDTSGTGTSGTVSLNGGPAVAFTNSDTDLLVTGPNGAQVFVDTTAITAGFSGNVDITADGSLSTDAGATEIAIDFSNNQVVTDSVSGHVTNIDSTNIRLAGSDSIEFTGTADAFQVLAELAADLRNDRELDEPERVEALTRRMQDIERISRGILDVIGEQSVTLESLDDFQRVAEEQQLETRRTISEIESADLTEVVVKLQEEQNLLQLTFASSIGLMDQSLLDFLR